MKALDVRKPLTTGQVARIVGVTKVTILEWIASRKLNAYVLPGGTHRRVKHAELRAFLKKNKMPTDRLDAFEHGGMAAIEETVNQEHDHDNESDEALADTVDARRSPRRRLALRGHAGRQ